MTDDMSLTSRIIQYWRPLPHIESFRNAPLELVIQEILPPLELLRHHLRGHRVYSQALREIIHFVSNLCTYPLPDTIFAQLKAIYPIRYWLHWAPHMVEQICTLDPLAALFQSHYHMVIIAVMPYFPAAVRCFALPERCQQVEALWKLLQEAARTSDASWANECEILMEGPRLIAGQHSLACLESSLSLRL